MTDGDFSAQRLAKLHDAMVARVKRGEVPGLALGLSRHGETHVDVVSGSSAMSRSTIFRISSMTKPITAAATMMLVDDGLLRLDEPIDRLLPELADRKVLRGLESPLRDVVPAKRPITLLDLLTFRMGMGIVMAMPGTYPIQQAMDELQLGQGPPNPASFPPPDEWTRRLGTLPLIHQPGEAWMYNTGADVLGVTISRASGRPLEAFMRERLFAPLGMTDTGFSVPPGKLDRLPTEYATSFATGAVEVYDEASGGQWSRPPPFQSGAAGLVSTIDDYIAFCQMMLGNGVYRGRRILSESSVKAMTTDHLTPEQKASAGPFSGYFKNHGWGFCVSVVTNSEAGSFRSIGTFGWDGGLGTVGYSDPKEDLAAVLMTQQMWASPNPPALFADFWEHAYQAIAK